MALDIEDVSQVNLRAVFGVVFAAAVIVGADCELAGLVVWNEVLSMGSASPGIVAPQDALRARPASACDEPFIRVEHIAAAVIPAASNRETRPAAIVVFVAQRPPCICRRIEHAKAVQQHSGSLLGRCDRVYAEVLSVLGPKFGAYQIG